MADDTTNTGCPVAALADEAQRLIKAHGAVDVASVATPGNVRLDAVANTTIEALDAVLQRASWLETKSAKGALFQICAAADMVGLITGGGQNCPNATAAEKAIYRLLHSVASHIERNSGDGARLIDAGGGYYLNPAISQHAHIVEAFRLAETQAKEAA